MTGPAARATLRTRLLLVSLLLLLLGLTVSDAVVLRSLRGHLLERVDSQIRTVAAISTRVRVPLPLDAVAGVPLGWQGSPEGLRNLDLIDAFVLAYVGPDGRTLAAVHLTSGAGGPRLPTLDRADVTRRAGVPFPVDDVAGGARWRVVAAPYLGDLAIPGAGGAGAAPAGSSVVVAASEHDVDATTSRLVTLCLVTGALLVAALGAAGWYAIRTQLRPLRRIEATAAAIAAGDLSRRVDAGHPGTEVGRLGVALNGMLSQLERAFAARTRANRRMRDFVADVSHELRTPLFAIHGSAQLYRMGALTDPAELERTVHRIESESARLARLATDLLLLARLDTELDQDPDAPPGTGPAGGREGADPRAAVLDPAPMDLRTLAADARSDVRALDPTRDVRVTGPDGGEPGSAPVLGDEARLRQVTANLVGNAVIHTPAGTPLRIGVGTVTPSREGAGAPVAVWEIEDAGPGLAQDEVERIFDPFYRVDPSRTRSGGAGAGLGLAIVRGLVTAHGGRVVVRSAPGEGTTMRMELPLLRDRPGPAGEAGPTEPGGTHVTPSLAVPRGDAE